MLHVLKVKSDYFESIQKNRKKAEVRYDDRGYAVDDILELHEWANGKFTGNYVVRRVVDIARLDEIGLKSWVLLSME